MDLANAEVSPRAADAVAALYAEHAFGLVWLAVIMLGDRGAAEDVVQDAFLALYRRWDSLGAAPNALAYVRTSVLKPPAASTLRWLAYPASAAAPASSGRVLYQTTVNPHNLVIFGDMLRAGPSGAAVLARWSVLRQGAAPAIVHFGVISHHKFTPLPPTPAAAAQFPLSIPW